jgi:hypothetical protein
MDDTVVFKPGQDVPTPQQPADPVSGDNPRITLHDLYGPSQPGTVQGTVQNPASPAEQIPVQSVQPVEQFKTCLLKVLLL